LRYDTAFDGEILPTKLKTMKKLKISEIREKITQYGGVKLNDFFIDKDNRRIITYNSKHVINIKLSLEKLGYNYGSTEYNAPSIIIPII
jgi:hypothetical protein